MTSFEAMLAATAGMCEELKVTVKDRYLSYLPVAHGMERWVGEVSQNMNEYLNKISQTYKMESIMSLSFDNSAFHCIRENTSFLRNRFPRFCKI